MSDPHVLFEGVSSGDTPVRMVMSQYGRLGVEHLVKGKWCASGDLRTWPKPVILHLVAQLDEAQRELAALRASHP